ENSKRLELEEVLYAPQLHFSLLSVQAAVKQDFRFQLRSQAVRCADGHALQVRSAEDQQFGPVSVSSQ
ncbi:hypothetical protein F444_22229, partial [Phytophthora nicotianae P1976]